MLKKNNYLALIKSYLFTFAVIGILVPVTVNAASMRDGWYKKAAEAEETQCSITHEKSPNYKSEEWPYGKKAIFKGVESYYKRLRKETVGSVEGLIEDKLCSEGRMKFDFFGKGGDYSVSPNVCYLGGKRSVEVFVGVADSLRGYDPDKLVEDAFPLCVQFFTEKYFSPTFERLKKEKN